MPESIKTAISQIEIKKEKYKIPDADVTVVLHGLTSRQLEQWRQDCRNPEAMDSDLCAAKLLQMSLHDEAGNLVFDETEVMFLGDRPAAFLEPMSEIAKNLNGHGRDSLEAIAKNLVRILGVSGLFDLLESIGARCPSCSKDTAATNSPSSA